MAKKKYEVSFELGGELQGSFSRAFSSAQDKFKGTEKSAKNLNDRVDQSTRKFSGLTSMFHKTSSGASAMTSTLKTAAGALAGLYVVKKGIDVGKTLINQYQGAFRIIKTGTGAAGKDLDGLMSSYHNLGSVVPDNLKDVATALSDFNTRTGATGKVLEDLSGKALSLTAIASADLGGAIEKSTRMFGDWSIPLEKGGETLDKLYIASQSTGIGVEELAEKMTTFGGPLRQMGFDFETSMALMGKWEKEGVNAELVLGSLRIALGKMAKVGVKDTNKALNIVIDKIKKAKTTGEATALAMQAFGSKAGPDMAAAVREGRFELGKLAEDLRNAKGAIDKDFADTETLDDKIQTIKNKFLVAAEPLGKAAADAIGGVLASAGTELTAAGNKLNALINTKGWKEADLTGKFHLTWENVISKPLNSWWKESGEKIVYSFGQKTGTMLGKGMWTGFKALLSESGKVFSGGGATSWLSLAILGKTAGKASGAIAPLVSTVGKFVKPASAAATAAGAAAEGTSLMAGAAAALTNPIGWAVLGVGALAGSWYMYKRHQENARQSLIHMGDALKEKLSEYTAIDTQTKKTQDLIKEYDRLKTKIADAKTPADELTEAKRKLSVVEQTLIDMYPDMLSQQDIENGNLRETAGLIDRINIAKNEGMKLKLEQDIAEGLSNKGKMEKEINSLQGKKGTQEADKEKYLSAVASFKEFENEFQKILNAPYSDDRTKQIETLRDRVNEVGAAVGYNFSHLGNLMGTSDELFAKYKDTLDSLVSTSDDLEAAKSSYQELYNAQKQMIELDLGGTIEYQAKKYKTMTDAQKQEFDTALQKLSELNRQMQLLPTDKKINIDVIQRTTGAFIPNAKVNQALPYADGGMITRPHLGLVGEAGPEAIIPLSSNRRSRALSLYEDVGRSLGVKPFANGGIINSTKAALGGRKRAESVWNDKGNSSQSAAPIVIEHKPSIFIQGSADPGTVKLIEQALRQYEERFGRMFEQYQRQKGRVSMSGPV
ncbi:hypothetical protein J23TS9_06020 [Paenibacillus sp. J23TS9]|uniref:hypothetical protein n=1 Tax=Paenibacillus sp. J23TS9 TaxID=2807193 RepID=UPI001B272BB9|nr:hypothetical protein [Paenibacillus sp. J23TS9]GIP25472.1 hypothetical protein J23TS9_06020 [Paenibacillus sp. J23TS9]